MAAKKKKRVVKKTTKRVKTTETYSDVVMAPLADVIPNDWNPKKMPARRYAALKSTLKRRWIKSQALLVWRTDEKGALKNVVIDGEQKWKAARDVGIEEGPMVFVDGITKDRAVELTLILCNRGEYDKALLPVVLRELVPNLKLEDPALELGFTQEEYSKMLGIGVEPPDRVSSKTTSSNAVAKMVPLYFDGKGHDAFMKRVKQLGERWELENVTEIVKRAVDEI